jgi:uncharacterized RDD family membrane protein YckC
VTDIPVGSPPVPPGRHAAPGGWYPDPLDPGQERYWDGWQWSRNTRASDAPPPPARPYGPGPSAAPNPYPPNPNPYQQNPYQQNPYQQNPYQQNPYQQNPYQQQNPYGQNPYPQQGYPPNRYGQSRVLAPGEKAATTADGVPLAGWWWRVLAVLIDSFIVSVVAAVPSFGIYRRLFATFAAFFRESMQAAQAGQPPPAVPGTAQLISSADQLLLTLIGLAVALAYHLVFVRWKAATPGKLVCRLRIVPVDRGQNRDPLPWNTVLIRVALWVLPGAQSLLLLFKVLDCLFPLWQPKRQALHDLAARTQVVKLG